MGVATSCLVVFLLAGVVPAATFAGTTQIRCPQVAPSPGAVFDPAITVEVGDRVLRAYTLDVIYDRQVVTIDAIRGGSIDEDRLSGTQR